MNYELDENSKNFLDDKLNEFLDKKLVNNTPYKLYEFIFDNYDNSCSIYLDKINYIKDFIDIELLKKSKYYYVIKE
jgi:hypothetical protein